MKNSSLLLLVAIVLFSIGGMLNQSYGQDDGGNDRNNFPFAPDFIVRIPTDTNPSTVTIPFSEHVSDPKDRYIRLNIQMKFPLNPMDGTFTKFSGTDSTVHPTEFTPVKSETVTFTATRPMVHSNEFRIFYNVTNENGLTSSGTIRLQYDDPDAEPPIAPDYVIEILRVPLSTSLIFLGFSQHVTDPVDRYGDLTIVFTVRDPNLRQLFTHTIGGPPLEEFNIARENPAIFSNDIGPDTDLTEFFIDYTVTNVAGKSASGVITLPYVNIPSFETTIQAIPYTINIESYDITTLEIELDPSVVRSLINGEDNLGLNIGRDISLTTTGIGNASGTLTITDATATKFHTLSYTPIPGFVGTETFDYTGTYEGRIDSSVFHIVVTERVFTLIPNLDVNQAAGGVTLKPCSMIGITDQSTPSLAHLTKWNIDGIQFRDGFNITISSFLRPGQHTVEFEIPHSTDTLPDGSFVSSTRDDFIFTIAPPINPVPGCTSNPTAPDFTVSASPTGTVIINFNEHVSDPKFNFDDLTVTFRLQDESLYESLSQFLGVTTLLRPTPGDILTVNGPVFFSPSDPLSFPNTKLLIDYTVTNGGGLANSGVVTVKLDTFPTIEAIPYTVTFDDLFGLSTFVIQIPHEAVTSFVVSNIDSELFTAESITLTTTGIGNATGTLSIIPATASRELALLYTPVPGYVGTETFSYTATFRDSTSSSEFHIVVPERVLIITPNFDVNQDNGGITLEPCSVITITDQSTPSLAHLTKWSLNDISFPDGSSITLFGSIRTGQYTIEFELPHSTATLPDGSFVSSTSDDFIFTIVPSANPVLRCPPNLTTPDFIVYASPTGIVTINFDEHVSDSTSGFDDLTVTFRLQDESLYAELSQFFGVTNTVRPTPGDILTVNGPVLFGIVDSSSFPNAELLIDYTVTNRGGLANSGVVTVKFVDYPATIEATPYTIDAKLFGLPILVIQIPHEAVTSFVTPNVDSELFTAESITLTTTGIGNATGTLSIIPATTSRELTLLYTPVTGYVGTETFPYTATFEGGTGVMDSTSSSEFHIVVPARLCDTNLDAGVSFGDLDGGQASDTQRIAIINTGNVEAQVMMKGDDWISVVGDIVIMNAGVTKYSLTDAETYAEKTSFTATAENIGDELGEGSLSVYLQLFTELINDSFRGDAAQELTVSSDCS